MARLRDVVIDCRHPASLARFWAAALDGYSVAPYDDEEIARLRSIGVEDVEDDPTVLVEGDPSQPRLWFQKVPEATVPEERVGKPPGQRLHLDLLVGEDGRDAEIERLIGLGAARLWDGESGPTGWVTMADPEGNVFCIS